MREKLEARFELERATPERLADVKARMIQAMTRKGEPREAVPSRVWGKISEKLSPQVQAARKKVEAELHKMGPRPIIN